MKTVKCIIFIVGLFLINFVGGIPEDSRNLFIAHILFLSPILVDFFPLLKINTFMKWPIKIMWGAGILILVANILGVMGIVYIDPQSYNILFTSEYYTFFDVKLHIQTYLLCIEIVYVLIFTGTLTLSNQLEIEPINENTRKSGKGLQKNVHS